MTENNDLIHLQHANAFQLTRKGERSPWRIRKNITGETLAELPAALTEAQVFAVLAVARQFELTAFNAGIAHGKKLNGATVARIVEGLRSKLRLATDENQKIANHLDKLTEGTARHGHSPAH